MKEEAAFSIYTLKNLSGNVDWYIDKSKMQQNAMETDLV